jgi:hypothetical protein
MKALPHAVGSVIIIIIIIIIINVTAAAIQCICGTPETGGHNILSCRRYLQLRPNKENTIMSL